MNQISIFDVISVADELRNYLGKESSLAKADLPWLGAYGQFQGLTA